MGNESPVKVFAGIDVSRLSECSKFLRHGLNPVLVDTGAVLIGAHHTGKPKNDKRQGPQTAIEYAYSGIGSSELVNWARAVMVLIERSDCFELMLAKRGARAAAQHPTENDRPGEFTNSIFLRQAIGKIFWEQTAPPVDKEEGEPEDRFGGAPSKVEKVLALGLGKLIDALTTPAGKNELAKRIENFAGDGGIDVSEGTCKKVVERLVENGAIKKKEGKYVKS